MRISRSKRERWEDVETDGQIYLVTYAAYLSLDTLPTFKPRFGIWGPLFVLLFDVFVTIS
jgi:dihydroceramidase